MTIDEIQNQIIGEFEIFDDWMDRYSLLIDLGKDLAPLPEAERTPQNLIEGCQSRVWLSARYENGRILFQAESDALLVKGIVALLIRIFSGQSPDDIINADLRFVEAIGLSSHLSPTRSNGLLAMIRQMKYYAMAFKAKEK